MDRQAFEAMLAADKFEPATTVERLPDTSLDLHSHPFEAKAMVITGELSIRTARDERVYRAGEIFHLFADVPHSETIGPVGVTYLVGRKQPMNQESLPSNPTLS